jgi:hypothetical protein
MNCWVMLNNELERMRKEKAMAYFEVLSRNLLWGAQHIKDILSQDSRCSGRDSNVEPAKSEASPPKPACCVWCCWTGFEPCVNTARVLICRPMSFHAGNASSDLASRFQARRIHWSIGLLTRRVASVLAKDAPLRLCRNFWYYTVWQQVLKALAIGMLYFRVPKDCT